MPYSSNVEYATDLRWFPSFLPDGKHYLYLSRRTPDADFRVSVASIDSGDTAELVEASSSGVYVPPGYLLFIRNGALMAQPFDASTRTVSGAAVAIVDRVGFNAITYQALFSASTTGRLVYQQSAEGSELVWFDRKGTRLSTAAAPTCSACPWTPPAASRPSSGRRWPRSRSTGRGTGVAWSSEC